MKKIPLGSKVKDLVTGFIGIAVSRHEYLNGCVQYTIDAPVNAKGEMQDGYRIDEQQLQVVRGGIIKKIMDNLAPAKPATVSGGPRKRTTHNKGIKQ